MDLARTRRHRLQRVRGFTLIELMVVIAVLALAANLVVVNLGALLPKTSLDGAAKELMGLLETVRTESKLQGKRFAIELDLEGDRYRIVFPPEEEIFSDQVVEPDGLPLDWHYVDKRVDLAEYRQTFGPPSFDKRVLIQFDERGFSSDQVIVLRLHEDSKDEFVWTIQIRGLQHRTELVRSEDGTVGLPEIAEEGSF